VNLYTLSRVVLIMRDAGAVHLHCTRCHTETVIEPDTDDPVLGGIIPLDEVARWGAGHIHECNQRPARSLPRRCRCGRPPHGQPPGRDH
jgi:hypothetical protein